MAKRKKQEGGGDKAPGWMATFADMMSLLLVFFVLLFSMSTIEIVKFKQMISSIQGALRSIPGLYNTSWVKPLTLEPQKVEPVQRQRTLQRAKEAIVEKARSRLVSDEQSKEIIIEGVKEGIRFTLAGRVLFDKGSTQLSAEGRQHLDRLAELLKDFGELQIRITGHTDSTAVSMSPFQDNWRLAQSRAYAVMTYLRDTAGIQEKRMSFASAGQYRPRFPNNSEENQALNRRVEITLLQGTRSESIMGVLQAPAEQRVMPDESDFVPKTGP